MYRIYFIFSMLVHIRCAFRSHKGWSLLRVSCEEMLSEDPSMFEDAINDVVCGNAYRTVVPRAKVAKACESVVSSVLARKAFADREDLALTICGSMCPCEGDR